jgi:hypothetical protein
VARMVIITVFAALFALAFWFRASSLGAFPWHDADESYYGLQTTRMLQGKTFEVRTFNRNILNPYLVGLEAALHLVARPALWVLRAPAVLCGVLAVLLTYVIGSRVLDRTTALIAAVLLAALPYAIHQSRNGLEMSQLPLAGLVVMAFALRGHGLGLLLSFLASMLVHPTAIFLIPIALTIFFVQLVRKGEGDPIRRRRILIGSAIGSLAVVATVSALIFNHPLAQVYLKRRPPLDWPRFLDGFERAVLFLRYVPPSKATIHLHRWIFRSVMGVLLILGTWRLARERRWERLALVAGVIASLVVFHLVAGPSMFREVTRYAVVFLLPTALATACLMEGLFAPRTPTPSETTAPALRGLPLTIALVLAWAMLLSVKQNFLDPGMKGDRESLWTFQPDQKDEYERALSLIRRDVARRRRSGGIRTTGGTPTPVIVHNYWTIMPLAYLASFSEDIEVVPLIDPMAPANGDLDDLCREKQRELGDRMRTGAYAIYRFGVPAYVGVPPYGGTVIEDTVNSAFLPGQVRRWMVPTRGGGPGLVVYRFEDEPAQVASQR